MDAKTITKPNTSRKINMCRRGNAAAAIGDIKKGTDTFCLTFGQFSLIDALLAILDKTGPAHVSIATWTAGHADLTRSAALIETADFLSLRFVIDGSFRTRQPKYYDHMVSLFGQESIRETTTHAKFMLVRNDEWDIVVRTSMNLNANKRLENIEVSENKDFAVFFEEIICDIFTETKPGSFDRAIAEMHSQPEHGSFALVAANTIKHSTTKEARATHVYQL